MHNPEPHEGQERWTALVRSLHDGVDALVAEFIGNVGQVAPYAQGAVPPRRLERDAVSTFDYLLRRIGDIEVPRRLRDVGPTIGRDRARRGVPLEDLLTAVRLDFQVLWHALRSLSGPDDAGLLVAHTERVWTVVEQYISTIQVSYLDESAIMARERRRERSALVGSLLATTRPEPNQVNRVALALDVEPEASFLVAASTSHSDRTLRAAADQLAAAGRALHVQDAGQHTILIARWHGNPGGLATSVLQGARCGVAPVADGLEHVPHAARIAREIADAIPASAEGPHLLTDAWTWLAGVRLGDVATDLTRQVLGGLEGIPAAERQRLLETVQSYAQHGSVSRTAASLFCHRNTVVNRLRRFRELTGYDMAVPRESALALLSLEWSR